LDNILDTIGYVETKFDVKKARFPRERTIVLLKDPSSSWALVQDFFEDMYLPCQWCDEFDNMPSGARFLILSYELEHGEFFKILEEAKTYFEESGIKVM